MKLIFKIFTIVFFLVSQFSFGQEGPPPTEVVPEIVMDSEVAAPPDDELETYDTPQNIGNLNYCLVKKTDYYSGDKSLLAWAGAMMKYIETGNLKELKNTFGIDSASILSNVKYINKNFNWPEEAVPGWLINNEPTKETWYLRSYYDKLGETYTYKYQIEIRFKANGEPSLVFRPKEKVVAIDDILNLYYKILRTQRDNPADDTSSPCARPVQPTAVWLTEMSKAEGLEKYDVAMNYLEKYLWAKPNDSVKRGKKMIFLYYAQKYTEAIKETTWKLQNPDDYISRYIQAISYYELGRYNEAVIDFKKLINDGHYDFTNTLSSIYYNQGKYQEVIELANKANAEMVMQVFKVKALRKIGKSVEADSLNKKIIANTLINNQKKPRTTASIYYNLGDYANAVKYHRISLEAEADKNSVLKDLSEALITNNEFRESTQITDKLLTINEWDSREKVILGYLNIVARYLDKQPYKIQQSAFNKLITDSEKSITKCNCWSFNDFYEWLENSKTVVGKDKIFVKSIVEKAKRALNP